MSRFYFFLHAMVMVASLLLSIPTRAQSSMAAFPSDAGLTARQFNLVKTGKIDAVPAIQALIAAERAVILPCGTYRLDESFPDWSADGIRLSGANMQCVILNVNYTITSGSVNVFHLSGHGQVISDMTINATRQMRAGAMIYLKAASQERVHDLIVTGPFWNGIYVYASNNVHIDHIYARPPFPSFHTAPNAQNGAAYAGAAFISLDGDLTSGKINIDTYLEDLNIAQYETGIQYLYTSGVYASNIDIVGTRSAYLFTPGPKESVNGVQMVNALGDTSYGANWYFPNSGGGVYEFMCSACWASSSYSDSGIVVENPRVSQIHFQNSTSINNSRYGLYISAGRNIGWIGGAIEMNNNRLGSKTDASDVYISGTAGKLDWIRIQDTFIGQGGIMHDQNSGKWQATYAVDLANVPATAHVMLTGLQTYNHKFGQFNKPANMSNISMANNQGD
ncbi:hypothetical protein [Gluconacetobacter liquefaciens]|uniref:Pectate lyase-like protein n=2 Tax=Gluconacetobacter liquefaciens TaxID=89584 RepID=A0A7W4JKA1_GLULI|nr:hypothetical protein [Gluconacetobacter liquefaciens]MBB2186341.1 hypothetical protein [Gluconacetobacter liquefaciens]